MGGGFRGAAPRSPDQAGDVYGQEVPPVSQKAFQDGAGGPGALRRRGPRYPTRPGSPNQRLGLWKVSGSGLRKSTNRGHFGSLQYFSTSAHFGEIFHHLYLKYSKHPEVRDTCFLRDSPGWNLTRGATRRGVGEQDPGRRPTSRSWSPRCRPGPWAGAAVTRGADIPLCRAAEPWNPRNPPDQRLPSHASTRPALLPRHVGPPGFYKSPTCSPRTPRTRPSCSQ